MAGATQSADREVLNHLARKISFVLFAFVVFRLGTYIPIPFVDSAALALFMKQNAGGLLGVLNTFAGGSVSRMSIFALSIMPYITSSIIIQLLGVAHKPLGDLRKEGESGRIKLQKITKYLTVFLCIFQSYGVAAGLEGLRAGELNIVPEPGALFRATTVITLTGGTMFLLWLGERISARGIGNGVSLLIFAGIVAQFPAVAGKMFEMTASGGISPVLLVGFFAMLIGLVFFVAFMEKAYRKVAVHYAKRSTRNMAVNQSVSYIPLKMNTAGVIPPIFASSFLLFPTTMVGFFGSSGATESDSWIQTVARYLAHGEPLYVILYATIIIFFSFFYTSIIFNSEETAENLRKSGGYITGYRPGKSTADYFDYILTRMTVIGAAYLCAVCLLPEMLTAKHSLPFYLGGTSVLIVVNVTLDTFSQISMQFYGNKYRNILRKVNNRRKLT